MKEFIEIKGASIHNLKNIDLKIPKNKLTVITGVSGSGKSSLAFDILYEEGKKRYLLFSGSQFMVESTQPFENISGLSPTVAVEQRIIRQSNPRSTVGTRTKISNMLAILFATLGQKNNLNSKPPLSMEMFQKNSPKGMCVKCLGTGEIKIVDEESIFSDSSQKIQDLCFGLGKRGTTKALLDSFCRVHKLSKNQTLGTLSEEELFFLKYGDQGQSSFVGFIPWILQIIQGGKGNLIRLLKEANYVQIKTCPRCEGTGLGKQALEIKLVDKSISELEDLSIQELYNLLSKDEEIFSLALGREIISKLSCMIDIGLHHLSLSRPVPTLSGGEIQRLFLASYIIADMDSIIFIFDEPTIGLHEVEKEGLINVIHSLVKRGNTVVAVEHDKNFIKSADYIVDLGPFAGRLGGEIIYQGDYEHFSSSKHSLTAPYLNDKTIFLKKKDYKTLSGKTLQIKNASIHNLKQINVALPLEIMLGIAGVSGSGKSSLINDTLVPKLSDVLKKKCTIDSEIEVVDENAVIEGIEYIDKCVIIDQKPIGRSKTSCPATYTGIYDLIRELFAETKDAKDRNFDVGHFSINSKGGCKTCKGDGCVHYYVGYGNFVDIPCDRCQGTGFNKEVLEVYLNGKTICDILDMTVDEVRDFLSGKDDKIDLILQTLQEVGMGYIQLGQKTPTISGGESQRIKLAKELAKGKMIKKKEHILYLFDEPTTGLSYYDSLKLLDLMQRLVDEGNSVIVIEHDPAILSNCDFLIELGPKGGKEGGMIIAKGTPMELKMNEESIIGRYLL